MKIGIDQLHFYAPTFYFSLSDLAREKGIDAGKYLTGIGQEKIAVAPPDEDIVTMGVNAALPIISQCDVADIDTVLFATETGIDQSKAAALYVHKLLNLPANCRAVELKQACYSATAALQLACAYVARTNKKVLLIAADIARYDLDSAAEPTQGAGAVAMLISANPRIAEIEPISGLYSEDVMDFWRPNYRKTPLVDGKFSTMMYLKALENAWQDYRAKGGHDYDDFAAFCYHLPFSKMAQKAHAHLARLNGRKAKPEEITDGMQYNRAIGNSYTAALYIALASLLDHRDDLSNKKVALFSYGSGCVGEFFAAHISPDYLNQRQQSAHQQLLQNAHAVDYQRYLHYHQFGAGELGQDREQNTEQNGENDTFTFARENPSRCRLVAISKHQRQYELI